MNRPKARPDQLATHIHAMCPRIAYIPDVTYRDGDPHPVEICRQLEHENRNPPCHAGQFVTTVESLEYNFGGETVWTTETIGIRKVVRVWFVSTTLPGNLERKGWIEFHGTMLELEGVDNKGAPARFRACGFKIVPNPNTPKHLL